MKERVITSIFIVLVCVPVLLLSKYIVYPLFLSVLSVIALTELFRCVGLHKKYAVAVPCYLAAAAMPPVSYILKYVDEIDGTSKMMHRVLTVIVITLFVLMIYSFFVSVFSKGDPKFAEMAEIFVMTAYIIASFTTLSMIRYIENGVYCFGLVFLAAWTCDTFAYFTGYLFGKHKLIEEISPKKTVEGAIGGIIFTVAAFLLYGLIVDLAWAEISVNYIVLGVSGLLLSVISQIGDLIASLIKREHNIKDFGTIFPGHGGVMDRFDSILPVSASLFIICFFFPPFF